MVHDGFECIFTRAVNPVTKRPVGPVSAVQHFHRRLTPGGLWPGNFRISVAQDKMGFPLGEQVHRLFEWRWGAAARVIFRHTSHFCTEESVRLQSNPWQSSGLWPAKRGHGRAPEMLIGGAPTGHPVTTS